MTGVQHQNQGADHVETRAVFAIRPVTLSGLVEAQRAFDLDIVIPIGDVLVPVHLHRQLVIGMGPGGVHVQQPRDHLDRLKFTAADLEEVGAGEAHDGILAFHDGRITR